MGACALLPRSSVQKMGGGVYFQELTIYMPCNRLQYYHILVCFKSALMEQFDWLMVYHKRMAVWSSATGGCGAQCVMMIGTTMMQQWCAGSWAIVQLVSAG